ncbi:uncharacterized protein LOC131020971 isoform X2 [Salvia miltiorrhiza]|uniref:uncharacterized protein LOC131020971 isoform X2 n=1 Tax=Salvia miltiorrhiza TaxID=226208 RepID=UPI0025AC7644|nr:uncharacterized protein LOC131020971 isoform X2 [Salvia miltiorrhiza]
MCSRELISVMGFCEICSYVCKLMTLSRSVKMRLHCISNVLRGGWVLDKELRQRLQDSERKLGMSMPLNLANERSSQLEAEATQLERRLILASGVEGMEGFRQRWSLHGRLTDTKKRLEALKLGMDSRKKDEPVGDSSAKKKRWFFW